MLELLQRKDEGNIIIVLLILAGVTIATLTGDNGILKQADKAKTETDEKGALEEVQLEVMGSFDKLFI